jgi:hypothetical protein
MAHRSGIRRCSKSGCTERAVATLSYNYGEQVATLVPLQQYQEPHNYDLCLAHSERLTVPRGWSVITAELGREPSSQDEDFSAIADAIRDVAVTEEKQSDGDDSSQPELRRRGHLRAL